MNKNFALTIAGTVFAILSIVHLLRLIYGTKIEVGAHSLSMNVSVVALIVSLILTIWMFGARNSKS